MLNVKYFHCNFEESVFYKDLWAPFFLKVDSSENSLSTKSFVKAKLIS